MAMLIQDTCHKLGLDFNMCRGQGYDRAGNMAGCVKGAAQRLLSINPKASIALLISLIKFIHCSHVIALLI